MAAYFIIARNEHRHPLTVFWAWGISARQCSHLTIRWGHSLLLCESIFCLETSFLHLSQVTGWNLQSTSCCCKGRENKTKKKLIKRHQAQRKRKKRKKTYIKRHQLIKTRLLHFSQASGRNWHFTYAPAESNQSENSSLPFSQITVIISNITFQFTLLQDYASMNQ